MLEEDSWEVSSFRDGETFFCGPPHGPSRAWRRLTPLCRRCTYPVHPRNVSWKRGHGAEEKDEDDEDDNPQAGGGSVAGDARFVDVVVLIESARSRAYQAVNAELVTLYWQLGEYISKKIAAAEWGDGIVDELAAMLARRYPGLRGYTRRNLFRMRQFYECYCNDEKVSPLVSQLAWTHHLIILSQARRAVERQFYIREAIKERWTKRELERQIQTGAVVRRASAKRKVSPVVGTKPFDSRRRIQERL